MMPNNFQNIVGYRVLNLLMERKALIRPTGVVFYVWPRADRLIVLFNPNEIDPSKVNEEFAHRLSTRLKGRRVVRTNSRGLFLQVGYDAPKAPASLEAIPLELSQQPTPWSVPVGMTARGPLWISLLDGVSYLMGGSTGGGKTGEEHAWIQALLHGGKTIVYGYDGKRGMEFARYLSQQNFRLVVDPVKAMSELEDLFRLREMQLQKSGYPSVAMHNEAGKDFMMPIAFFCDEAADLPDEAKVKLEQKNRLWRYLGFYPVITTNQPTQAQVMAKTNLVTRLAFRVPHHNDSITMIGYKGAESLPPVRGRGLIVWRGDIVEFQSFVVNYPMPDERITKMLAEQITRQEPEEIKAAREQDIDPEQIRGLQAEGLSVTAIIRKVSGVTGGSKYYSIKDKIEQILGTSSTSSGEVSPENGINQAPA